MDRTDQNPISDEWGERISALLDGELSDGERREVEGRLADDPAAAQLARDFTRLREACAASPTGVFDDLRETVLAEIARREDAGEDRVEVAGRLEPEGEFGLPFGRSSRSWAWAGLAAAAAVMIGFYGRPEPPAARGTVAKQVAAPQITEVVQRVQQALPQTQQIVIDTPEKMQRLRELLRSQGFGRPAATAAPPEMLALRNHGLPVDTAVNAADNQLLLVSAEQPKVRGLIDELERDESLVRVGPDRSASSEAERPVAAAPGSSGIVLRIPVGMRPNPQIGAAAPAQRIAVPAGHTRVLFVIKVKPKQ